MSIMPRVNDCPSRAKRDSTCFSDDEFRGHFKFRKHDFMRVLQALGLTTQDGHHRPVCLRVGRPGTHCIVLADWALMVLIKRLSTGGRYRDLAAVLGGGKTVLCTTFLYMLEWLYTKYKRRLRDLKFFRARIPDFIQLLENLSQHLHGGPCPFTNLIAFVDGHLVTTARPGGEGCVHPNMYDTDVYNGNKKVHGLKYQVRATTCLRAPAVAAKCEVTWGACVRALEQGVTLPIGLCLLEGPWGGPEADSTMLGQTSLESDLADLSAEIRVAHPAAPLLCAYGDNAYAESLHIVRASPDALATQLERWLNDEMKPMRVLVEQNFAVIGQVAGITQVKLSLGSGPVGMVYPVACLLTNIYTLLYGNTITCSVPGALDILAKVSVEEYLHV